MVIRQFVLPSVGRCSCGTPTGEAGLSGRIALEADGSELLTNTRACLADLSRHGGNGHLLLGSLGVRFECSNLLVLLLNEFGHLLGCFNNYLHASYELGDLSSLLLFRRAFAGLVLTSKASLVSAASSTVSTWATSTTAASSAASSFVEEHGAALGLHPICRLSRRFEARHVPGVEIIRNHVLFKSVVFCLAQILLAKRTGVLETENDLGLGSCRGFGTVGGDRSRHVRTNGSPR